MRGLRAEVRPAGCPPDLGFGRCLGAGEFIGVVGGGGGFAVSSPHPPRLVVRLLSHAGRVDEAMTALALFRSGCGAVGFFLDV